LREWACEWEWSSIDWSGTGGLSVFLLFSGVRDSE
jgi:hypothetical protein